MNPPPARAAMLAAATRSRCPARPQCGQAKTRPAGLGTRRAHAGQVEDVPRSSASITVIPATSALSDSAVIRCPIRQARTRWLCRRPVSRPSTPRGSPTASVPAGSRTEQPAAGHGVRRAVRGAGGPARDGEDGLDAAPMPARCDIDIGVAKRLGRFMTADRAGPAGPFAAGPAVTNTGPPFRWTAEHDEFRGAVRKLTEARVPLAVARVARAARARALAGLDRGDGPARAGDSRGLRRFRVLPAGTGDRGR